MRIVYDHQIFTTQEYGGISRYFFEVAQNIAQGRLADVKIISPLYVNSYLPSASPLLTVAGIKVRAIRRTGRLYRALNCAVAKPLATRYRPDIVHETYYSSLSMAPDGCKVVLTVFDMIHEKFPTGLSLWEQTVRDKASAVKRADHIICISEHTRRDLVDLLGVPEEKTTVIHLGVSLNTSLPKARQAGVRPFLLHVGGRSGYKNFEMLLQAYASRRLLMQDYELVAFGSGRFTAQELNRMQELGIPAHNIRNVSGDDAVLSALYQQASVLVFPSLYEGFGLPPLEAMRFDCPVVCSNASSLPEVVGDAALLVDPRSPEMMAAAIETVLLDRTQRAALIERGRQRTQRFSWEDCARQTMDVYRRVVA